MKTVWPLFLVNLVASSYVRYNRGISSTSYNTPQQNQYSFYQFLQRLHGEYLNHQRGQGGQTVRQSHGGYPGATNTYRTDETRGQAGQLGFNDDLTYPTKQSGYQSEQTLQTGQSVGRPSGLTLQVAQTRTQTYPPGQTGYQGAGQTHPSAPHVVNTGQFGVGDDTLYQSKQTGYQVPSPGETFQTYQTVGWPSGLTLHVAQTGSQTYLLGQTGHQGYQTGGQTDQSTVSTPQVVETQSQTYQKPGTGGQTDQTGQLFWATDLAPQVVQTVHEAHQPGSTDNQSFQAKDEINQSRSVTPGVFLKGSETNSPRQAAGQTYAATGSTPQVEQSGNTRQSEQTGGPTQQTGKTVDLSQQQVIKEGQTFLTWGHFVDQYGQTGGPASHSDGTVGQTDQMLSTRGQVYQTGQQTNVQPGPQDNGILTDRALSKTVYVQTESSTNKKATPYSQTLNQAGQKGLSSYWTNQTRASTYVPVGVQTRNQLWVQARNPYRGSMFYQTRGQQGSQLSGRPRYQYGSTLLGSRQRNPAFVHTTGQHGSRLWRQPGSQQQTLLSQTGNSLRKCQGEFVCVPRHLCESPDIHTTLTCSNPQHVCCDD